MKSLIFSMFLFIILLTSVSCITASNLNDSSDYFLDIIYDNYTDSLNSFKKGSISFEDVDVSSYNNLDTSVNNVNVSKNIKSDI